MKTCPHCGIAWEAEETIYDYFFSKYQDHEKALTVAKMYGHTPEHPKQFGINHTGIEVRGKYDGVSYWRCDSCQHTFDRWTMIDVTKEQE